MFARLRLPEAQTVAIGRRSASLPRPLRLSCLLAAFTALLHGCTDSGPSSYQGYDGQEVDLLVGEHQLVEFADILEEVGVIATEVAGAELSRK